MAVVSMKQLLEAGVHFGHQTRRWNPKMAKYIFTERNGIYIIDLQKTITAIKDSYDEIRKVASSGKSVLFVAVFDCSDCLLQVNDMNAIPLCEEVHLHRAEWHSYH